MFYLVYGIIFVVIIAGCVMAAKHWHWINTVFLILTFLSGIAASMGMAQVLYKRSKVVRALIKVTKENEQVKGEYEVAVYGEPSDIGYGENSLRAVSNKLNLELLGRGRVWSGGAITADGENQWSFKFASEVPEGEDAQLALLEMIEVQVFRDQVINQRAYPVSYIGEFRIVKSTSAGFSIEGLQIIDSEEAGSPTDTWSIYEKMPLDRRDAFKAAIAAASDGKVDVDKMSIAEFRQVLQTEFFPEDRVPFSVDSPEYERMIDSYAFNGLSLGKIEAWVDSNSGARKSGKFSPRPAEVHVKYRFNTASQEYSVDADGTLAADGPFTPLGLAISRDLHLGAKVTFEEGDEVLIDQFTAEGYQRDGGRVPPFSSKEDVTEIDRIYLREYRDYPFMFSSLRSQGDRLTEILQKRTRDNQTHDTEIAKKLQEQIQERIRIKSDLEADNGFLEKDRELIVVVEGKKSAEVDELERQVKELLEEKVRLRRKIGIASAMISKRTEQAKRVTVPVSTDGFSSRSAAEFGVPIVEPGSNYGTPINLAPPVYSEPQPIYNQGPVIESTPIFQQRRSFQNFESQPTQPIQMESPQGSSTRVPEVLKFSDQSRNATGTEVASPGIPVIEAPAAEGSIFEMLDVSVP